MAIIKAEPGKTRIGWIGTGVMGRWMCQHLMTKGYKATVYNRSKDKAKPLLEAGAAWADTPQGSGRALRRGLRHRRLSARTCAKSSSAPQGALAGSKAGTVLVDMTTSEPSLAQEIYDAAKAKGVHSVDAPVSGGDVGAKNARAVDHGRRRCGRRRGDQAAAWSAWARRSSTKGPPAPGSTRRWSTRS